VVQQETTDTDATELFRVPGVWSHCTNDHTTIGHERWPNESNGQTVEGHQAGPAPTRPHRFHATQRLPRNATKLGFQDDTGGHHDRIEPTESDENERGD